MNEEREHGEAMDAIGRLVRLAGPRTQVPPDRAERVHDRVLQVWERSVRRRRLRRAAWMGSGTLVAVAASLFLVLRVGPAPPPEPPPLGPTVARVERAEGVPTVRVGSEAPRALVAGVEVRVGEILETGPDERVALRWDTGHSIRLDRASRLRLSAERDLLLERGAVYVDSAGVPAAIEVTTSRGSVQEIGTQFEVRLAEETVRIRVREGSIRWDGEEDVVAGNELTVLEDGSRRRAACDLHGPQWRWTQEIAPRFALEGASLEEYLGWVARETGRRVEFHDPSIREAAGEVRLHGDLEAMSPEQTLAAVLPTCGLRHRLVGEIVRIEEAL